MNKKLLLISLICLSTLAAGCGSQNSTDVQSQKTSVVSKTQTSTSINYQLVKNVYTNKKVIVNYPQITNFGDVSKQKVINNILKQEALKVSNYYKDSPGEVTLDIIYNIKYKGNDQLSVQYSGTAYVKGSAHPNNLFYTTNINLTKAVRLRLSDFVKIDKNLVNKLRSIADKSSQPGKVSVEQYTNDELIKMFKNADSLDLVGTADQSDTFSFVTKDTLGISVPVSHAAGDHAEFEMKR
ncbi:hypothetical protein [Clostridium sp.]|uniref:hypothetical protein n=1 Tax=Clostridium sp. TaxID=1506 RepID=UPI0026108EFC|nr:hypothetical protein [uncultured Clostridium sp.]